MIIPRDAIIAEEKIRDYLLKPLAVDDKSGYFAIAGYTREEYWELLRDIRDQLLPAEAAFQKRQEFRDFYQLQGKLKGPNGKEIGVRSIWTVDPAQTIRFISMFPD